MDARQFLKTKRSEILQIAAQHGARNVRVFGSASRDDVREPHDYDFLVDLEPGPADHSWIRLP